MHERSTLLAPGVKRASQVAANVFDEVFPLFTLSLPRPHVAPGAALAAISLSLDPWSIPGRLVLSSCAVILQQHLLGRRSGQHTTGLINAPALGPASLGPNHKAGPMSQAS